VQEQDTPEQPTEATVTGDGGTPESTPEYSAKRRYKEVDASYKLRRALYSQRPRHEEFKVGETLTNALITDGGGLQNQRRMNHTLRLQLTQKEEAARKLLQENNMLAEECIRKEREDLQQLMEQRLNEQQEESRRRFQEWVQGIHQADTARMDEIISQDREAHRLEMENRWQMEVAKLRAEKEAEVARLEETLRAEVAKLQVRRTKKEVYIFIGTW
jgi:hypothetical protein